MTQPIHVWGYASGCPACDDLKSLLTILSIPFEFHVIDRHGSERAALKDAGFRTVPQVFTQDGRALGDLSTFRKTARLGVQAAGLLG